MPTVEDFVYFLGWFCLFLVWVLAWVVWSVSRLGLSRFSGFVSFYWVMALKAADLFELVVAECTRLTGGPPVGLGLLQPQSSSWRFSGFVFVLRHPHQAGVSTCARVCVALCDGLHRAHGSTCSVSLPRVCVYVIQCRGHATAHRKDFDLLCLSNYIFLKTL